MFSYSSVAALECVVTFLSYKSVQYVIVFVNDEWYIQTPKIRYFKTFIVCRFYSTIHSVQDNKIKKYNQNLNII